MGGGADTRFRFLTGLSQRESKTYCQIFPVDDAHILELGQDHLMANYHHGNLEEALISTGAEELDRVGPTALSLRSIASKAGVSHNAPYRHFRHKEALIFAICEKAALQLAEQIEKATLLYPASTLLQSQYIGRLFAELALRHPARANLMFGGFLSEQSGWQSDGFSGSHFSDKTKTHLHQNIVQSIGTVLAQNRDEGLILDLPPHLALTLFSALRGYALWIAAEKKTEQINYETFDRMDQIVQNILLGLLP